MVAAGEALTGCFHGFFFLPHTGAGTCVGLGRACPTRCPSLVFGGFVAPGAGRGMCRVVLLQPQGLGTPWVLQGSLGTRGTGWHSPVPDQVPVATRGARLGFPSPCCSWGRGMVFMVGGQPAWGPQAFPNGNPS